jgi:Fe-S oxidoreductase
MLDGRLVKGGFRAPEVHAALDLCLSCKGCLSDCPTGVDMASYKAEVLYRRYRRRIRPRSHYALGWLPRHARAAAPIAGVANVITRVPGVAGLLRLAAGVDQRRNLPALATERLSVWGRRRPPVAVGERPSVLLWSDTFTEHFSTGQGRSAVAVLESAGYQVHLLDGPACCGLTWISTGQLDGARRQLRRLIDQLHPYVSQGLPIIALEPSCLSVLRSDGLELLDDPRMAEVAAGVSTLSELLSRTATWRPPDLSGVDIVVQPHCHHASVLGFAADMDLLVASGANVTRVGGCCGLAGNFGAERGHYEVSVAVAEQQLLPAVRAAGPKAVLLADGFSCRTQLADLAGRPAIHLAELLGQHSTTTAQR